MLIHEPEQGGAAKVGPTLVAKPLQGGDFREDPISQLPRPLEMAPELHI